MTDRSIPSSIRRLVIQRAHYCEYCQLSQQGQEATFHIDHIHPVSAGGKTPVFRVPFERQLGRL